MTKWVAYDPFTKKIVAVLDSHQEAQKYTTSSNYAVTTSSRRVKVGDRLK